MRQTIGALLILAFVALASLPWLVMTTRSQPLLPEELRLARQQYEMTVEVSQEGTLTANRQATSVSNVRIIGTVAGGTTAEPQIEPPTAMPTATLETIIIVIQSTLPATEPPPVGILTPQPDLTGFIPVTGSALQSGETPSAGTPIPTVESIGPLTPANLVDVEDKIIETQLADQIRQDADGELPNLRLTITPEGIRADSTVTIFPGIAQHIEAGGILSIENHSLVFRAEYVRLNGEDVSALYRNSLESQINTTLYRLLPGRFVQSYELGWGEIRVKSGVRP